MEGSLKETAFQSCGLRGNLPSVNSLLHFSPLGLRKLEAFFGFLITIMALTFGYEASITGLFINYIIILLSFLKQGFCPFIMKDSTC